MDGTQSPGVQNVLVDDCPVGVGYKLEFIQGVRGRVNLFAE